MIKSQDELNTCNDGHRGSEVLLATIEKCELLEKENKQLRQLLKECKNFLDNLYYPVIPNDYDTNITNNLMKDISNRINTAIGESEK